MEDERDALFQTMKEQELTQLYQQISSRTDHKTVEAFITAAAEEGIDVYLLTGDPSWGLDASGRDMAAEISRASAYTGLRGVVMDVEPYLTEGWESDPDTVMERYVQAMLVAKKAADEAELELIACVPYFFDDMEQTERLEALVAYGCHKLAVMNYDKGHEAANLETEAELTHRYGRPLITIYELQAPGEHDLTERNTYYHDGLDAIMESWDSLRQTYGSGIASYALHNYDALREVLDD